MGKHMNKALILFVLLIVPVNALAGGYTANHDKVVSYFKSGSEKKVKDAVWTTPDMLNIGVLNDGSNRSGFAEYCCLVLNDYGFYNKGVLIKIVDIGEMYRSGAWNVLGEYRCQ